MYNRLYNFLTEHNILSTNQFGFRKKYSTFLALMDLVDNISKTLTKEITVKEFFNIIAPTILHIIMGKFILLTFTKAKAITKESYTNHIKCRLSCPFQ